LFNGASSICIDLLCNKPHYGELNFKNAVISWKEIIRGKNTSLTEKEIKCKQNLFAPLIELLLFTNGE
jgi:hypothetical protein